jgi:SPP1 family predicted phage head-tail adaptor
MEAGLLRHRVELQRKHVAQDPNTGAISEGWATDRAVWAWVQPLSTREFLAAGESVGTLTARITIRYLPGVDHTWRVLHRDRVYNVEGVMPDKESGLEYLTLQCSEGAIDG